MMSLLTRHVLAIGLSALLTPIAYAQGSKTAVYRVQLTQAISTKANRKGDKVKAQVLDPSVHKGAILEGAIKESKSSGTVKKQSFLNFGFSELFVGNNSIPVQANVLRFYNSKGRENVDEEGQIIAKKNDLGKALLIAGLGAGVGAAVGGAQGAGVGAGAGAIAGLLFMKFGAKAPNISFDAGSIFDVELTQRGPAKPRQQ